MNAGDWVAVIGALGSILGGGGGCAGGLEGGTGDEPAAAQEAAARANAAPAQQAANLAVLEATVRRVDEENGQLRGKMSRLEAIVRAFAATTDRWARQMNRAGIEPEPPHPLVEEYNRTGA